MAVSPADFELYSRVTGRPLPRSPQERMKLAPEVNRFIRNREYERPEQTTLQKGADVLGKVALIGGTLAAAHALGGGFKGKTAEKVGKVAEAAGLANLGGDFGVSGGGTPPYPNYPSGGGLSGNVDFDGAALLTPLEKAEVFLKSPPVRPAVTGEQLPTNAFGVPNEAWDPITKKVQGKKVVVRPSLLSEAEKQMQAERIYGEKLTKAERVPLHRQYDTIKRDQSSRDYPGAGSTQEAVDNFLRSRADLANEAALGGIPLKYDEEGMVVRGEKGRGQLQASSPLHPLPLSDRRDSPPPVVISETPPVVPPSSGGTSKEPDYSAWDSPVESSDQNVVAQQPSQPSQKSLIAQADELVDEIQTKPTTVVPADDPAVQRVEGTVSAQPKGAVGRVLSTIGSRAKQDTGTLIKALDDEPFGALKEQAAARDLSIGIALRGLGVPGLPKGGLVPGTGFNEGATQEIIGFTGNLPLIRQGLTEPAKRIAGFSPFRGAEVNLPNWLGGGFEIPGIPETGQIASNVLASNPDLAAFMNARGVTIAELAALGIGTGVGGAAKDLAKVGIKAGKAVAPFHNRVLVPAGRAAAGFHGNVLVPQGRQFHQNVLVPQGRQFHQNVLVPAGREFHQNVLVPSGNAALDGIQRNMNALRTSANQQFDIAGKVGAVSDYILPATRETGDVVPGRRLNDHPDIGPLEQDTAPSRAIQVAKDAFKIAGEGEPGSLTPDDVFIRTDIASKDPANVRTWAGERRPSARTKAEFAARLRDSNAEWYDRTDLPERRVGGGGRWMGRRGSEGQAASLSPVDYGEPTPSLREAVRNISGESFIKGLTQPLSDQDIKEIEAARGIGKKLAETEIEDDIWRS